MQTDLDEKGIAKNAREEKRLARDAKNLVKNTEEGHGRGYRHGWT